MPAPDILSDARTLHSQGDFAAAEQLYLRQIREQPGDARAWHGLGLMTLEGGWPQQAIALLDRARGLDPRNPAIHDDLGRGLHRAGRLRDAVAAFGNAIAAAPDFAEAYANRALALCDLGEPAAALASADRAIALKPGLADAHNYRGLALTALDRQAEALDSFAAAVALAPFYAQAHNNHGLALMVLDRQDEALESFSRAIAALPGFAMAYNNRGLVLGGLERFAEALADYDQALALAPQNADAHYNRANLLSQLRRHDEALTAYARAIALRPDLADAYVNRGLMLARMGALQDAIAGFDQAIALRPDLMGAYTNKGLALAELGRASEALATYAQAEARNPAYRDDADFCRALLALQRGDWAQGWRLYEARRTCSRRTESRDYPQPQWRGQTLQGKTLYVYAEQGLGDTIMFARYLGLAAAQGAKVIFSPQTALHGLMRGLRPLVTLLPWQTAPENFDYHAPLLSLPLAFGTGTAIPHAVPYLEAEPERVTHWRNRLGADGFKIGVSWSSSGFHSLGMERSFPLAACATLAQAAGVRLISLQKKDGLDELAGLPPGMTVETLGNDYDCTPDAFLDSAAVLQMLDLVISCDTAIAHLAGALGRPVWVALKQVPEWRWLLERSDSPWYPTMTLFRQPRLGDWDGVFAAMRDVLDAR